MELRIRLLTELSSCQYGDLSIPVAEVNSESTGLSPAAEQTGCDVDKTGWGHCPVSELVSRCCAELTLCQYGDLSIPVAEVHTDLSKLSLVAEQVGCEDDDGKDVEACHVVGLQGDVDGEGVALVLFRMSPSQ